ncbi:MAG: DNA/RNA nuclease SfsA [Desulfobulbus sp.]
MVFAFLSPMLLPAGCQTALLCRRYKRFLADVRLADGSLLTVHCPNSGSMRGCSEPGSPVVISPAASPGRKYAWTLEMVQARGIWVGVHTGRTNRLVREGLESGVLDEFGQVDRITQEVVVSSKSRLDFCLEGAQGRTYLEVKHCSLAEQGVALFPDAVTTRGTRHLLELARLAEAGYNAAVLFCVQRSDAERFRPAAHIDPGYAETATQAAGSGVRFLARQVEVTPQSLTFSRPLPVELPEQPVMHP